MDLHLCVSAQNANLFSHTRNTDKNGPDNRYWSQSTHIGGLSILMCLHNLHQRTDCDEGPVELVGSNCHCQVVWPRLVQDSIQMPFCGSRTRSLKAGRRVISYEEACGIVEWLWQLFSDSAREIFQGGRRVCGGKRRLRGCD